MNVINYFKPQEIDSSNTISSDKLKITIDEYIPNSPDNPLRQKIKSLFKQALKSLTVNTKEEPPVTLENDSIEFLENKLVILNKELLEINANMPKTIEQLNSAREVHEIEMGIADSKYEDYNNIQQGEQWYKEMCDAEVKLFTIQSEYINVIERKDEIIIEMSYIENKIDAEKKLAFVVDEMLNTDLISQLIVCFDSNNKQYFHSPSNNDFYEITPIQLSTYNPSPNILI